MAITTYKGVDIFVTSEGNFHATYMDNEMRSSTLADVKDQIDKAIKFMSKQVKRVKVIIGTGYNGSSDGGNFIPALITSATIENGTYSTHYNFWVIREGKEKDRRKINGSGYIYRYSDELLAKLTDIKMKIDALEKERHECLEKVTLDNKTIMKEMGYATGEEHE